MHACKQKERPPRLEPQEIDTSTLFAHFCAPDSKECQELVGNLCQFSYDTFGPTKTAEFTRGADLWLIARAKFDDGAVVTQEGDKKPVRIPTVCKQFGVPFKTIFQMNRELKSKALINLVGATSQ
ncbi:MAG: DUF4411 family protein [Acidobacteriota bacterium]